MRKNMRIVLHQNFKKKYKKLSKHNQQRFKERRDLFLENPFHPALNNHTLHGKQAGYRSINITGDIRLLYQEIGKEIMLFITIGAHSEFYN
jgi:addiction module RelE/StbE family toxin